MRCIVRSILIFFTCLIVNLSAAADLPDLRPPAAPTTGMLVDVAERQGFGYKAANLLLLKELCDRVNRDLDGLRVMIPAFIPVSSQGIIRALRSKDFDVDAAWARVVGTADAAQVLRTKVLPPAFWEARAAFEHDLRLAWSRMTGENINELFSTVGLREFIDEQRGFENTLMVRSTGKEDTIEFANAGGNESVAGVAPTIDDVLAAMLTVVASYAGERSLKQRLALGDRTILEPRFFAPVLLQVMIGEGDREALQASGVMFTQDPAAPLRMEEAGGFRSSKITIVESAWGHNAGVVNNLVTTDRYNMVSRPGSRPPLLYSVIRPKKYRLKANKDAEGGFEKVRNSRAEELEPTLTRTQLLALKRLADRLEDYFGYDVDVEFSARGDLIYVFQVRPIVHSGRHRSPSFFKSSFLAGAADSKDAPTIVSPDSAVVLAEKKHILVAPDIGRALSMYQETPAAARMFKLIIVGAPASSTSHEATTFRNEGKTVMHLPAWRHLRDLDDAEFFIAASPQQSRLLIMRSRADDRDLDALYSDAAVEGWFAYPIPRIVSVVEQFIEDTSSFKDFDSDAVEQPRTILPLLEIIKTGRPEAVRDALHKLLVRVRAVLFIRDSARDVQRHALRLYNFIKMQVVDLVELAEIAPTDPLYVRRLFTYQMLEAAIFQQQSMSSVVDAYSVATVARTIKDERDIRRRTPTPLGSPEGGSREGSPTLFFPTPEAGEHFVQLQRAATVIFSPRVGELWNKFTVHIAQLEDATVVQRFTTCVARMINAGVFTDWLNATFYQTLKRKDPDHYVPFVADLEHELLVTTADITELQEKIEQLELYEKARFADSATLAGAQESFRNDFIAFFTSADFIGTFNDVPLLLRMQRVKAMRLFVETFDEILKTIKSAAGISDEAKLIAFRNMLQQFLDVLRTWVPLIREEDGSYGKFATGETNPNELVSLLAEIIDKDAYAAPDMLPTPGVAAYIYAVGSSHDWAMDSYAGSPPRTAEDAYTIVHQSLLHIISFLNLPLGKMFVRPRILYDVEALFASEQQGKHPSFVGIDTRPDGVDLHYNMTLGQHGCRMLFSYSHKTQHVSYTLSFCGGLPDERSRWEEIAVLAYFYNTTCTRIGAPEPVRMRVTALLDHLVTVTGTVVFREDLTFLAHVWTDLIKLAFHRSYDLSVYLTRPLDVASMRDIVAQLRDYGAMGVEASLIFFQRLLSADGFVTDEGAALIFDYLGQDEIAGDPLLLQHALKILSLALAQRRLSEVILPLTEIGLLSGDEDIRLASYKVLLHCIRETYFHPEICVLGLRAITSDKGTTNYFGRMLILELAKAAFDITRLVEGLRDIVASESDAHIVQVAKTTLLLLQHTRGDDYALVVAFARELYERFAERENLFIKEELMAIRARAAF